MEIDKPVLLKLEHADLVHPQFLFLTHDIINIALPAVDDERTVFVDPQLFQRLKYCGDKPVIVILRRHDKLFDRFPGVCFLCH